MLRLEYVHVDDPEGFSRVHEFESDDVELWALPDGSVLLKSADGAPLWDDFPDVDAEDE